MPVFENLFVGCVWFMFVFVYTIVSTRYNTHFTPLYRNNFGVVKINIFYLICYFFCQELISNQFSQLGDVFVVTDINGNRSFSSSEKNWVRSEWRKVLQLNTSFHTNTYSIFMTNHNFVYLIGWYKQYFSLLFSI